MAEFRWIKKPSEAWNVHQYVVILHRSLLSLLWYHAAQVEAEAKRNASWTDRTGNARQTLAAFAYAPQPWVAALVLKQHMDYGKWLELANGGRYAIVMRTLETQYAPVWKAVKDLVS